MLTNRQSVQQLTGALGLRPQRAAGQSFLIDPGVVAASLQAAKLVRADTVLEIGAGLGALTEALANAVDQLIAVELDRRLARHLRQTFGGRKNVTIIEGDIFNVRLDQLLSDRGYHLVANVPYSITSLVFRNFLTLSPRPKTMTLLIQREVADRLVGRGGDRSLLTLLADLTAQTRVVRYVDRTSFWPAPAVESSMVHVTLTPQLPADFEATMRCARMAFAGRRKQLKNSLAAGLQLSTASVEKQLAAVGIPPTARPQELTVEQWQLLSRVFVDTASNP